MQPAMVVMFGNINISTSQKSTQCISRLVYFSPFGGNINSKDGDNAGNSGFPA
jgi:hypothetical protein